MLFPKKEGVNLSGKLEVTINQYASLNETVPDANGVMPYPFHITRFLDYIRNDGPGNAVIKLDGGGEIPLLVGEYIGPWADYKCDTVYIRCTTQGQSCLIRGVGV